MLFEPGEDDAVWGCRRGQAGRGAAIARINKEKALVPSLKLTGSQAAEFAAQQGSVAEA